MSQCIVPSNVVANVGQSANWSGKVSNNDDFKNIFEAHVSEDNNKPASKTDAPHKDSHQSKDVNENQHRSTDNRDKENHRDVADASPIAQPAKKNTSDAAEKLDIKSQLTDHRQALDLLLQNNNAENTDGIVEIELLDNDIELNGIELAGLIQPQVQNFDNQVTIVSQEFVSTVAINPISDGMKLQPQQLNADTNTVVQEGVSVIAQSIDADMPVIPNALPMQLQPYNNKRLELDVNSITDENYVLDESINQSNLLSQSLGSNLLQDAMVLQQPKIVMPTQIVVDTDTKTVALQAPLSMEQSNYVANEAVVNTAPKNTDASNAMTFVQNEHLPNVDNIIKAPSVAPQLRATNNGNRSTIMTPKSVEIASVDLSTHSAEAKFEINVERTNTTINVEINSNPSEQAVFVMDEASSAIQGMRTEYYIANDMSLKGSDFIAFKSLQHYVAEGPEDVRSQIILGVEKAFANKEQKITMHLHPESLGKVDVDITLYNNEIKSVKFFARNDEVRDLLKNEATYLHKAISSIAKSGDVDLSFNLHDENKSYNERQPNQENGSGDESEQSENLSSTAINKYDGNTQYLFWNGKGGYNAYV